MPIRLTNQTAAFPVHAVYELSPQRQTKIVLRTKIRFKWRGRYGRGCPGLKKKESLHVLSSSSSFYEICAMAAKSQFATIKTHGSRLTGNIDGKSHLTRKKTAIFSENSGTGSDDFVSPPPPKIVLRMKQPWSLWFHFDISKLYTCQLFGYESHLNCCRDTETQFGTVFAKSIKGQEKSIA